MNEKQRSFIKQNAEMLNGIYSEKISEMVMEMLESKSEDRDRMVDVINTIRTWLRETELIKKDQEIKKTNFI